MAALEDVAAVNVVAAAAHLDCCRCCCCKTPTRQCHQHHPKLHDTHMYICTCLHAHIKKPALRPNTYCFVVCLSLRKAQLKKKTQKKAAAAAVASFGCCCCCLWLATKITTCRPYKAALCAFKHTDIHTLSNIFTTPAELLLPKAKLSDVCAAAKTAKTSQMY